MLAPKGSSMRRSPTILFTLLLFAGCGARSSLDVNPPADGGRPPDSGIDSGLDAGVDSGPPDSGTLLVDCGRSEQYTAPRLPIELIAEATSPDGIVGVDWSLVDFPIGSSPVITPGVDPSRVSLTPDVQGDFLMQFTARDGAGRFGSCEVTVHSIVGPPVALCPEEMLRTVLDVPLVVVGDGFDDEMVVAFQWDLVSAPPGATPRLTGVDTPVVEFVGSVRGTYVLRLTVFDFDMASGSCEVPILVTGPPEVVCPMSPIMAPTRQPVTIAARSSDDVGIMSRRWDVLAQPAGSTATPMPANADTTMLTPDKQGRYQLRFTATDVEGLSASCEVTVIGTPTPPVVTCPAMVTTSPLRPVMITASAVDDGTIVSWSWVAVDRPPGSGARPPSPTNAATTTYTPDIAGVYRLTVTATDDDGMTGTCTTVVNAGNVDGIRVEMFWDTNGTDMDTHLMNPTGTVWGGGNDDCYFGNCVARGGAGMLEWGAPGTDDNPRLDIDDTDGRGPENINVFRPQDGTYRVAVHNWRGGGPNRVTVRIYCGGSTTVPRQTFGPVALRENSSGGNDFWRVADIAVSAAGCTITDLARPTGPWIERYDRTRNMR